MASAVNLSLYEVMEMDMLSFRSLHGSMDRNTALQNFMMLQVVSAGCQGDEKSIKSLRETYLEAMGFTSKKGMAQFLEKFGDGI